MINTLVLIVGLFYICYQYSVNYILNNVEKDECNLYSIRVSWLFFAGVPIFIMMKWWAHDDLNIISWLFWCTWGISVVDYLIMRIPRNMIYLIILLWFLNSVHKDVYLIKRSIYSAVTLYIVFFSLYSLPTVIWGKKMLGYGDVRLAGTLGFFLQPEQIPVFVFFSSLSCLLWGGGKNLSEEKSKYLPIRAVYVFITMDVISFMRVVWVIHIKHQAKK